MVRQVRLVAVLSIVQGGLECLAGVLYVAMGPLMRTFLDAALEQQAREGGMRPQLPPAFATWMAVVYALLGLAALAVGALRIVAGIRGLKYRGRILGIVSFAVGVASFFTCYCAPTSLALMVYGLIVYLNADVGRAFEMAKGGASADQIRAAFPCGEAGVSPAQDERQR
jgi:RsiW-degrading membrane proteinase PrsW (M82 family)